jgi:hypothetical protein
MPWKFASENKYSIEDLALLVPIYIVSLEKYLVFKCSYLFDIQAVVKPIFSLL